MTLKTFRWCWDMRLPRVAGRTYFFDRRSSHVLILTRHPATLIKGEDGDTSILIIALITIRNKGSQRGEALLWLIFKLTNSRVKRQEAKIKLDPSAMLEMKRIQKVPNSNGTQPSKSRQELAREMVTWPFCRESRRYSHVNGHTAGFWIQCNSTVPHCAEYVKCSSLPFTYRLPIQFSITWTIMFWGKFVRMLFYSYIAVVEHVMLPLSPFSFPLGHYVEQWQQRKVHHYRKEYFYIYRIKYNSWKMYLPNWYRGFCSPIIIPTRWKWGVGKKGLSARCKREGVPLDLHIRPSSTGKRQYFRYRNEADNFGR